MGHVPHLVVPAPWEDGELALSVVQWRHMTKVLRLGRGDAVSYTDGLGTVGKGRIGSQSVLRGDEWTVARPSSLAVAVAPPTSKDRQRFVVEKLAELGVRRLSWLRTGRGRNREPAGSKSFAWSLSAAEQSRGAWLMEIEPGLVTWDDLERPVTACTPGGAQEPQVGTATIAIGPEGGFAEGEIPEWASRWDLGPTVLRVETAAVVAAARSVAGG